MMLLVAMAMLGALLGAGVRPPLIGALLAVALADGLRSLIGAVAPMGLDGDRAPIWAVISLRIAQAPIDGYWPLFDAAGGAAVISALLVMVTDAHKKDAAMRPVRKGRYVRSPSMIKDRPAQSEAEARQKALLGL